MGQPRKYSKEHFKEAIETSLSIAQALRKVGLVPAGGNYATAHRLIRELKIDTTHMRGQGWNVADAARLLRRKTIPLEEILVEDSEYRGGSALLKKRLIENGLLHWSCEVCLRQTWNGMPIPLELEHINGKRSDNRLENLKLLCPNCHAQTPTYRGKNVGNGM